MAADNSSDLEGVLDCYAPDAMLMPPDGPPVKGVENIRPRYASLFESSRLEVTLGWDEIEVAGSWAFSHGTTKGRVLPRDGSDPTPLHDKYLMVLQKNQGKKWQIAVLMWNPAQ